MGMGLTLGMGGGQSPSLSLASPTSPVGSSLAASSRSALPEFSASKSPLGGGLPSRFRGEGLGGAGASALMSEIRGLGSGASSGLRGGAGGGGGGGGDTYGENSVGGGKAREYASMSASQQQMLQQRMRGGGGGGLDFRQAASPSPAGQGAGGGGGGGGNIAGASPSSSSSTPGVPSLFGRGSKSMHLSPAGGAAASLAESDRVLVQGRKVSA